MSESQPPTLRVHLLGAPRILLGDREQPRLQAPLMAQLVAYLVLAGGQPVPRRELAAALWPSTDPDVALQNLRQLPARLRSALPGWEGWFELGPGALAWAPTAPAFVDVHALAELARQAPAGAVVDQALELARGELLHGIDASWIRPWRRRFDAQLRDLLVRAANELDGPEALGPALALLERAAAFAPGDGALARLVGDLRLRLGDRAAALLRTSPSDRVAEAPPRFSGGAATSSAARPLPFVGRDQERSALEKTWQACRRGSARVVEVRGPPGVGKTALARRFAQDLASTRAGPSPTVLTATCASAEAPYAALATLAAGLPLAGLPPLWKAELSRLLPELRDAEPELPEPPAISDPLARVALLRRVGQAFLKRAPLLLVIDDADRCDAPSLRFVESLAAENPAAPLLVMLVGGLGPAVHTQIALEPLTRADAAVLAAALAPPGTPLDPALDAAGGNPGLLTLLAQDPPRGDEAAALARAWVERLGPAAVDVAGCLAVLGDDAHAEALAALTQEERRCADGLAALVRAGLVAQAAGAQRASIRFRQPLTRAAVEAGLPPDLRRALRRRAAELLLREDLCAPERRTALCAHLREVGGGEAAQIALRAARTLAHPGGYEAAGELLEAATALLAASPNLDVGWQLRLGRIALAGARGRREEAETELRLAGVELRRLPDGQNRRLELLRASRDVMYTLGDVGRALSFARAEVELTAELDPRAAASAWMRYSGALVVNGDREGSERALDEAELAVAANGGSEDRATLLAQRAANERYLLRLREARRTITRAVAEAEACLSAEPMGRCRLYQMTVLMSLGEYAEALGVLDGMLHQAEALEPVVQALVTVHRAEVLRLLDRPAEALGLLNSSPSSGPLPDDLRLRRDITRALSLLSLGRTADAAAELDAAGRVPNRTTLRSFTLASARARSLLALGRAADAEAEVRATLPLAQAFPIFRVELLDALARARLTLGEPEEAVALVGEALSLGEAPLPGEPRPPYRLALEATLREAQARCPEPAVRHGDA